MNLTETLLTHARLYPKMQPVDAVKLAFQAVFGPEHMIPEPGAALERLKAEYSAVTHTSPFRTEALGRFSRVYIDSELSGSELSLIGKMFITSASSPKGDTEEFEGALDIIASLANEGRLPFSADEFGKFRTGYENNGVRAVSHSDIYRSEYKPAYRLVDTKYVRLLPVIFELSKRLEASDRVVLATDGRAASGKSTAAELIAGLFDGAVVHLDDFFLPFDMRTAERLAEPGGNLDRERFSDEVVPFVRAERFSYRVFDCSTGGFRAEPAVIEPGRLLICEGAYSLHPAFGNYFDLAVFSTITPEEQKNRILARNGGRMWLNFRDRWIPMEEKYFAAFGIEGRCGMII